MKFQSAVGRLVQETTPLHELEYGEFFFLDSGRGCPFEDYCPALYYRPPGVDMAYRAPLTTDPAKQDKVGSSGTFWWWNGDKEAPTLRPSIAVPADPPYLWHGFLKGGHWEACE